MLQTRNAKRPAQAAVRFAVDAVGEGLLTKAQAITTIDASSLDALLHPTFDPSARYKVLATRRRGLPRRRQGRRSCSPPPRPSRPREAGEHVILVRPFTEADDVAGFFAAQGILTSEGGKASHAALVARGMGRPCVCGASASTSTSQAGDRARRRHRAARGRPDRDRRQHRRHHGRRRAARRARRSTPTSRRCSRWADELRTLGVRANADMPEDARRARELRRRGHRALPHRAHVHGRGPPAEDARDDHGLRRGRPPRRARQAAAAAAGRLRGPLRGDGRPAGHDPPARPAAARVPARPSRARRASREAQRPQPRLATSSTLERVQALRGDQPDARHPRLPARDPATPRSTRCRSRRSCVRRAPCKQRRARRRTSRS